MRSRAAITAAVAVFLSACGSGGSSTSGSGRVIDTAATFTTTAPITDNLDPVHSAAGSFDLSKDTSPALETLVDARPDGSYVPKLATGWSWTENNSALQFKLRKGVKFHDGTAFDAQAVKANFDRARTTQGSRTAAILSPISRVDVVDDSTINFTPQPGVGSTLLSLLSDSPALLESPGAFNNPDLGTHPVGTGPFKFASFKPNQSIGFDRNADYWGKKPSLAHVTIMFVNNTQYQTQVNAVQSGQVDAVQLVGPKQAQVDQLTATGLVADRETPGSLWYLNFNRSLPQLQNPTVRQAIGYAIDRKGIGKALNMTPTDEIALPGSKYEVPKYRDYYTYDPARAKKMLADAGYPDGFDVGDIMTTVSYLDFTQAVQSQLAAVGIKTNIHPLDSSPAIIATCFVQQKCPMFVSASLQYTDPTRWTENNFLPDSLQNMGKNVPQGVTDKVAAARQPTSDAEHVKRARELVTQVVIDAPDVIAGDPASVYVHTSKVSIDASLWHIIGFPDYASIVKYRS